MLADRPAKAMLDCARARAAQDFERGYAESVALHKRRQATPAEREPAVVEKDTKEKDARKAA